METYQINGITVCGEIKWTRIGEPVDMDNDYEMARVYGMDITGRGYCAVGYIEDGLIDDIVDETFEIL
mgnify:FL=1|tara:strand:- start:679 stop:882 length:204 start_codon:yes stop_codon:yes gene_type:complete